MNWLCVGNFNSNTGYAWLLIEDIWIEIRRLAEKNTGTVFACYPKVTEINPKLSDVDISEVAFNRSGISQLVKNIRLIRQKKIEILYLTDQPLINLRYLVYRLAGVKRIIVHDHSPGYKQKSKGFRRIIKSWLNSVELITCDLAIGVSPYICERLSTVNCFPDKKIKLVTNGVPNTSSFLTSTKDRKENQEVSFVTVARANYYKGIDFGIKCIASLVESGYKEFKYIVIGDGPNLEDFKQLAIQLGVEGYIDFLGKRTDVSELLPTFDFAFHPSKGEAMCLAIVEYMRSGLPTLCSDNRSVNSILVENSDALFYNEGSVDSAVIKLKDLLDSKEMRFSLGQEAMANFNLKYTRENMNAMLMDAIDQFYS